MTITSVAVASASLESLSAVSSCDHLCCDDLVRLFDQCFADSLNTRLIKGGDEPIYLPAALSSALSTDLSSEDCVAPYSNQDYHRIIFTRDYFASALHEISHWCVAGEARRQQVDFGYWYAPDGRSAEQQQLFEQMEIKPQALEWIFSVACGRRFRVSADNLEAGLGASESFKDNIYKQVLDYCRLGLNDRALLLNSVLADFYEQGEVLLAERFVRESI